MLAKHAAPGDMHAERGRFIPDANGRDRSRLPDKVLPRARYVCCCANCDRLFESSRRDRVTCSGACRVSAHRNGLLKALRELANTLDLPLHELLQMQATSQLCPQLFEQIGEGTRELDDLARQETRRAFAKSVPANGTA